MKRRTLAAAVVAAGLLVASALASRGTSTGAQSPPVLTPVPTERAEPARVARSEIDAAAGTFRVELESGPYRLRGDVIKPEGAGPFPVIVYNHGSERDPGLDVFGSIGDFFQAEGYVVFFPYRRGSAGSEGPYWQDEVRKRPVADEHEAAVAQLDAQNDDVLAAIAWIGEQPYADRTRIAVAGCSFGGIETVLAAERSTQIYAAVDFAGASDVVGRVPPRCKSD